MLQYEKCVQLLADSSPQPARPEQQALSPLNASRSLRVGEP